MFLIHYCCICFKWYCSTRFKQNGDYFHVNYVVNITHVINKSNVEYIKISRMLALDVRIQLFMES